MTGIAGECDNVFHDYVNLNITFLKTTEETSCHNQTCGGVFGLLQRGEADFMIASMPTSFVDELKLQFIDVVGAIVENRNHISTYVGHVTNTFHLDVLNMMDVFNAEICLIFSAMMFFCLILLSLSARAKLSEALWFYGRIFVGQARNLKSISANKLYFRLLVLGLLIPTFLFLSICMNLISTELLSVRFSPFVNTLADLVDSGKKMLFMSQDGSAAKFRYAKSGTLKTLWERHGKVFKSTSEFAQIVDLIEKQNFAIANDKRLTEIFQCLSCLSKLQHDVDKPENNIYISQQPFEVGTVSVIMRRSFSAKGKDLKKRLEISVRRRMENGIYQYILDLCPRRFVNNFFAGADPIVEFQISQCLTRLPYKEQKSDSVDSISFLTFQRLFVYAIIVEILTVVIVCVEFYYHKKRKSYNHKRGTFLV